jgi:hypothetical protein
MSVVSNRRRSKIRLISLGQGTYDTEFTWPCVGTIGITQYDHMSGGCRFCFSY